MVAFTFKFLLAGVQVATIVDGTGVQSCWSVNYNWVAPTGTSLVLDTTTTGQSDNATVCNQACSAAANCEHFSFRPNRTSSLNTCTMTSAEAIPAYASGYISGPDTPDCDCPGHYPMQGGFPGANAQASMLAWERQVQPRSAMCWPKTAAGYFAPCAQKSVLFDVGSAALPWPGTCASGMTATDPAVSVAECEDDCRQNPFCPAWLTTASECQNGVGYQCAAPVASGATGPTGGQRILHGSVRILATIANVRVVGLKLAFDQTHHATPTDGVKDCMYTCYSNIFCQYWQYVAAEGCFVEDPQNGHVAAYPLHLDANGGATAAAAGEVTDGQFIQHYCLETQEGVLARPIPGFPTVAPQDPGPPPRFNNAPMSASASLIGAVLMCCSGVSMLAYTLTRSPKKESKAPKTRAIKPRAIKEPMLPVVQPQPQAYMQMPVIATTTAPMRSMIQPQMRAVAPTATGSMQMRAVR